MCKPGRKAIVQPHSGDRQLDQGELDRLVTAELQRMVDHPEGAVAFTAFDVSDAIRRQLGRGVFVGHYVTEYADGREINDGVRLTVHRLAPQVLGQGYTMGDRHYSDEHAFVYQPVVAGVATDPGVLHLPSVAFEPADQADSTIVLVPIFR